MVNEQVYPVEVDTLLLASAACSEVLPGDYVLEIGTGSGFVSASLTRIAKCVVATDISPHAVLAARQIGLMVVRCDLASALRGPFDLVLFNPPYLPTCSEERVDDWLEYALDGGRDGRSTIRRFAEVLPTLIGPDGRALLLVSSITGIKEVREVLTAHGLVTDIAAKEEVEGELLVVLRCQALNRV
ncbi:MAG: methyltransferase [Methanomicrobiales archaeon]|nr:methyltransferase [Methanomicrobiales archaeon]